MRVRKNLRQIPGPSSGEVVMARPHRSKSIVQLTQLVDDKKVTKKTIAEVIDELSYRTTPKAKKLLVRLNKQHPSLVSGTAKPVPASCRTTKKRSRDLKQANDSDDGVIPRETELLGPEARDIVQRLAVLRETYTEEAEILARWGITTALPDEMRTQFLDQWKAKLTDESDRFGRSRATLEVDTARLRHLAEFGRMIEVDR